jgi:predicted anti-sigma-YlaC factor YlaD
MRCEEIRELLPAQEGRGEATLTVRRHLSRCPECRAELARYEALGSAMRSLESHTVEPPPGLAPALAAIPTRSGVVTGARRHVTRNRRAYAGGLAAIAVAGTGAVVWRARARRLAAA